MKNAEITSTDPLEIQMSKSGAQHPVAFSAVQADQLAVGDSVLVDVIDRRVFLVNKEDAVGSGEPDDGSVTYSKLDPSFHAALEEAANEVRLAQEAVYDEGVFADNVITARTINASEIAASTLTVFELTAQNATIAGDLLANSIEVGSLDADVIGAGKIDAQYIDVDSITISGDAIVGGTLDANDVTIDNLTVDELSGTTISAFDFIRASSGQTLKITNTALVDSVTLPALEWTKSGEWTEATISASWRSNGSVDLILRPQLGSVIIDGSIEKKQAGELAAESWVDDNYIATTYRSGVTPKDVSSDTLNGPGTSSFLSRRDHQHAVDNPLDVDGLKIGNNWLGTGIRVGRSDGTTFRFYPALIKALDGTGTTSYARLDADMNDQGSHRHLKDNIQPSNQSLLDGLRTLPIYDFTMKAEDDGPVRTGFMIDELPETVQTVPDPNDDAPPGYKVAHMFGWVIKAVQELADELDHLKGEKNGH